MHINPSTTIDPTLALPAKKAVRVPLADVQKPVSNAPPATAADSINLVKIAGTTAPTPPTESAEPLTMDGLLKAWGQTNSQYDLNADGIVNVDDLLAFISLPVSGAAPGAPDPAAEISTDSGAVLTIADPAAEFTVAANPDPNLSTLQPADPKTANETPQLTIDGLLDAWGQSDSEYDINNDGTVNVDDLLALINSMGSQNREMSPNLVRPASSGRWSMADAPRAAERSVGGLKQLADTLADRMLAAGFASQPPTNLHDIVSKLNLSPKQSNFMLKQLSERYPQGLGLNVTG